MKVLHKERNGRQCLIKAWTDGILVEEKAEEQLFATASLPFIFHHVAVMPDVHVGMGATIGSVIATQNAIIPSAVGVDIGCGMIATNTEYDCALLTEDKVHLLHKEIERVVPHGRTNNGAAGDRGAWCNIPDDVLGIWEEELEDRFVKIVKKYPNAQPYNDVNHLGTLGTGNHFIELCADENNQMWIMLHSGSRGPGNKFGMFFSNLAKEVCKQWFVELPDKDLAYFPKYTEYFLDYLDAAHWAQRFARLNREIMLGRVHRAVEFVLGAGIELMETVNCHHNYVATEHHFGRNILVTRKGAIRAREGDMGIIPGSMGSKSYIVRGLGNPDSFDSASHGAGRVMSRTRARNEITLEEHQKALVGVVCDNSAETVDESPGAYKNLEAVMDAQRDLVEVKHTVKQFLCVKGAGDNKRRKKKKDKK